MSGSFERFIAPNGSTAQDHLVATEGSKALDKLIATCSKVPAKVAPLQDQFGGLCTTLTALAALDKGGLKAAIATDRKIESGNRFFAPSAEGLYATDPNAPQEPRLSTPLKQAVFLALRLNPNRLSYILNLANVLAKHDLKLAVQFLACRVPRPCSGGMGAFKSGNRCELPFCTRCNGSRSRALCEPLSRVLVEAGYAGRQVEAIVLTQELRPRESAAEAYDRLNTALKPKLRALKGRNGLQRLDLLAVCLENVIKAFGGSHFHAHVIAAWNKDLAGDLVDRFAAFWRLEVGKVKRVPLFQEFKGRDAAAKSLAEMTRRVAYHRKANVRVEEPTDEAIAALANMARDLSGVKLRRKIWMEPTLNRVWSPTSGMAHVHFLKNKKIGFFKVRAC